MEILSSIFDPVTYSYSAFGYFEDYSEIQPPPILEQDPTPRRLLQKIRGVRG